MSTETDGAVLVRSGPGEPRAWMEALDDLPEVRLGASPSREAREALRGAACALVDGLDPDPAALARRVHTTDPTLQVVIVVPGEVRARLQHALLFAPGVGEVWVVDPAQVLPDLVERAGSVTGQRRRYRATRREIERGLAVTGPPETQRARISDAFLASILQAVPDPVLSIDGRGEVLSWNPAAERVLGRASREAVGREIAEVVAPERPGPLRRLVEKAAARPARGEIPFRRADGVEGIAEVTVTPVREAGEGIRSVILHDVTEERRVQSELENQAGELEQQTAELATLNDELQERTRELEDAIRARSRFYAAMSHELRTPINAIIGYNSLLLDGIYGPLPEKQVHGLRRAQLAAQHLLELVNDVLDLAKIEAGRIELQVEQAVFPSLLAELLETVRSLAEERGSELLLAGPEKRHAVVTDPRRVRQILLNLLSNAVKFGERKPIRVSWEPLPDGGVEVRVADRGRGIAPEDLHRIFEEFEQVDPQQEAGTGLGLPISRRLAHLLGGSLRAESTPGRGSTFTLALPPDLPAELPRWRTGDRTETQA